MSSGKLPGSGMCLIFKVKWDHEQLFLLWEIHEIESWSWEITGSYYSVIG